MQVHIKDMLMCRQPSNSMQTLKGIKPTHYKIALDTSTFDAIWTIKYNLNVYKQQCCAEVEVLLIITNTELRLVLSATALTMNTQKQELNPYKSPPMIATDSRTSQTRKGWVTSILSYYSYRAKNVKSSAQYREGRVLLARVRRRKRQRHSWKGFAQHVWAGLAHLQIVDKTTEVLPRVMAGILHTSGHLAVQRMVGWARLLEVDDSL